MNNDEEGARMTSLEEGRGRIAKHRAEIGGSPAPREQPPWLRCSRTWCKTYAACADTGNCGASDTEAYLDATFPSETVPTPASPAATPRTDAALNVYDCNADEDVVSADFARTLERELNAREAQIRARLESSPSATAANCITMEDCTSLKACEIAGRCLAAAPGSASATGATSSPVEAGTTDYKALYTELVMQVTMKHPGETLHQTALRYLRNAEHAQDAMQCCSSNMKGEQDSPRDAKEQP